MLLTTPSVVTQPGAAGEEDRGEQDSSLQHLSALISKSPVHRSLSLPGGTWWLLKSCFSFGLGREGRSGNLYAVLFGYFHRSRGVLPGARWLHIPGQWERAVPCAWVWPELPVLPLSSQMQRLGVITEGWWDREGVRQGSIPARAVAVALQPMHDSVGEQPRLPRCGSPAMSPGAQDSSVWGTVQRAMEVRWDSGDLQLLWPWMGT